MHDNKLKKDKMTLVKQRHQLIPPRDIYDKIIPKSDWTRSTPGLTKPKGVISHSTFPRWISPCKKSKISLESLQQYCWSENPAIYWTRGSTSHTQPKAVVLHATFTWCLSPYKESNISIGSILWDFFWKFLNLIGKEAHLATFIQRW